MKCTSTFGLPTDERYLLCSDINLLYLYSLRRLREEKHMRWLGGIMYWSSHWIQAFSSDSSRATQEGEPGYWCKGLPSEHDRKVEIVPNLRDKIPKASLVLDQMWTLLEPTDLDAQNPRLACWMLSAFASMTIRRGQALRAGWAKISPHGCRSPLVGQSICFPDQEGPMFHRKYLSILLHNIFLFLRDLYRSDSDSSICIYIYLNSRCFEYYSFIHLLICLPT